MAIKIKFPLKMADGSQVRTIEELREHFDLAAILGYYNSGRLSEWLIDRYYEAEAEKIKTLDSSSEEFKKKLCEIFAVPYSESVAADVDLAEIAAKNKRYERLKQFTADDAILASVDKVAFSQEELADLLDSGTKLVYLCGEKFSIPYNKGGVKYIGVNNPMVDVDKRYHEKDIVFEGVQGANIIDDNIKSVFTSDPDYFGDLPNDAVKKAAENGNINAQLELACRYHALEESPSGLNNPEQSEYWYDKVHAQWDKDAKNGNVATQYKLGLSYMLGYDGYEMDDDKSDYWYKSAFDCYKKLAEKGDAEAQYSLGILFERGEGVAQDMDKAIYWLELSAKQGDIGAMQELAGIYEDDECVVYDKDKSEYWLKEFERAEFIRCKKAAEQGNASEQSILGDYYANGKGIGFYPDKADFWYKLALTGFKKAAEQGDARAQMRVARCYHDGKGLQADKQTAFMWYKKAADQENNQAMKIVGDCYATGDGVEQNHEECLYWYRKAAEQGNREAASQLPFKKAKVVDKKMASERKDRAGNTNSKFQLTIQNIIEFQGSGIVVEGVIEKGSVRTTDEVMITKKNGAVLQSVVIGIEMFRKIFDYAEEGDEVGLLLRGISPKDISKDDVVSKN